MLRKSRLALLAVPVFPKLENILQNEELYLCCIFVSSNTFRMRAKNINKERGDRELQQGNAVILNLRQNERPNKYLQLVKV